MFRDAFFKILEAQTQKIRMMGFCLTGVLLVLFLFVPLIGRTIKTNELPGAASFVEVPQEAANDEIIQAINSQEVKNSTEPPPKDAGVEPDAQKMIWPLQGDILRGVGICYSQTFSDYRYHNGLDIKGKRGTEIVAVLDGTVLRIETSQGEAKKISIKHGNGWQSEYAHLEEVYVKAGDAVGAGKKIGLLGQPGSLEILEGSHLHFVLIKNNKVVNPVDFLPKQ